MKFYSWDTGMGGTSPSYAVLCQFRTKDGKSSIEDFCVKEDEEPAWVSKVHSIKRNDGTTYYIIARSFRASSNDGYMWMDAFVIDKDTLRNVSVLDCSDDLDECGLVINYLISDWYYRTNGEGWDWLFEYDADSRNLYVPLTMYVEEVSPPIISDRYKMYHFDGMGFTDKGESSHKGLHQSLSQYIRLAKYFRTKNYIIRVDKMDNGDYRYASWKSSSTISNEPELVVMGGKYDEKMDSYTFYYEGVEYIVGYNEDKHLSEGGFEHHEFLMVRKDGNVLLKEERISNTD
ncbi:MAG: hypothetical protein IKH01_06725 [Prevotella sp.]|nr:hypothetical protein [Prevotella sp.]